MADQVQKNRLARARLEALRSHPPRDWDEIEVADYHDVVTALEEVYEADFSAFRISQDRIKPRRLGGQRSPRSGRYTPRAQYSAKLYCENSYVQRQIGGLHVYLQDLDSDSPEQPGNQAPSALAHIEALTQQIEGGESEVHQQEVVADETRTSAMVVFGSSIPVTIVRAAGTPEERSWDTRMGGDFARSALFQPDDRVVTGDELYSDLFDEPRVVVRVDPVLGSGQVVYWKATITPRSAWNRLHRNDVPPKGQPFARNVPRTDNARRAEVSTDADPKVPRPFDEVLVRDRKHLAKDTSVEPRAIGVSGLNFNSEAGRNRAVENYTKHWTTEEWTCSEASLARSATVDPADLSKWKKGLLPADSDKVSRIEKALRNNQRPTPAPKKPADE